MISVFSRRNPVKNFRRQMREVEHAQRNFQFGVKFFELRGDFARIAARTIGADDQANHGIQFS
jgi:hypothetical protein